MRLALSLWGLIWAIVGTVAFVAANLTGWAIACGVVALLAAVDLFVVLHRMRQGPHWQPGRDVPPFRHPHR